MQENQQRWDLNYMTEIEGKFIYFKHLNNFSAEFNLYRILVFEAKWDFNSMFSSSIKFMIVLSCVWLFATS